MSPTITWLHLSDIHFNARKEWRDAHCREQLLDYLAAVLEEEPNLRPDLVFCTGDVAFGELRTDPMEKQYEQAARFFEKLLNVVGKHGLGLAKERLFIVPGNHDVNRMSINADAQRTLNEYAKSPQKHVEIINQRISDKSKEFVESAERLREYNTFIQKYLPHLHDSEGRSFWVRNVPINGMTVGIAGFNSAWSCSGEEDDRHIWIGADWQLNEARRQINAADLRIGLMHHPLDWLNQADRNTATTRAATEFDFWLHGHEHSAWVTPGQSLVTIAAGAVGAASRDEFGINITAVRLDSNKANCHLHGRGLSDTDWTITPVAKHAPRGVWSFSIPGRLTQLRTRSVATPTAAAQSASLVLSRLLEQALQAFNGQPKVWAEPTVSRCSETAREPLSIVQSETLFLTESSLLISAPPQFGSTCLVRYIAKEAWHRHGRLWIHVDAKRVKPNKAAINEWIDTSLSEIGCTRSDVFGLIFDGWAPHRPESSKALRVVSEEFAEKPIICTHEVEFGSFEIAGELPRQFEQLYLFSLPRPRIRKLVAEYNHSRYVGDEAAVLKRLVSDLTTLNLHRTPLNCLTILKVYEADFDESPVNRAEMIKRVLFLLFNVDAIPRYKSKPDVKDCEYVLGFFCEHMIRKKIDKFSRDEFLYIIQGFCRSRLIDIDVTLVFDVLFANNIVIADGTHFRFKFAYWISYFVAQRMHNDSEFEQYVFSELRYARLYEVVEFFFGIDRQKSAALVIITRDLKAAIDNVRTTCGLRPDFNPYRGAIWKTNAATHEDMTEAVANGVKESNLPDEVKDSYADKDYDRAKPYVQKIGDILQEGSVHCLMGMIRCASRALRNSDYVDPNLKTDLLKRILSGWEEISKVVMVIAPLLAAEGRAQIQGARFFVSGIFNGTDEEKMNAILSRIPSNIVSWYADDLFSQKMSPLLVQTLGSEEVGDIARHELVLMILSMRPRGWNATLKRYVEIIRHNSFYLLDLYNMMCEQYQFGFVKDADLPLLRQLLEMTATKHVTGDKSPSAKLIGRQKFVTPVVPPREASNEEH